jgi:endoribonuclease Dicer
MKCIIFVNRIVTARLLSYILQKLKFLASWKCDFLVGVHSGVKSMSRKTMNIILERFRSGEVMLIFKVLTLVASFFMAGQNSSIFMYVLC